MNEPSTHVTTDGEILEVHPLADLFPLMPDDELAELAADIKERGLRVPIALDNEGRVVDGRNRLRACAIADVEPQFQRLNGEDIAAYIVSQNINRRHLTKGQRAMSLAMIYPETHPGKRSAYPVSGEVSSSRLSLARIVLRYGKEDLAPAVMAGTTGLDDAHKTACERRDVAGSKESQLAELRRAAPDLADMVEEDRLSLSEARSIYQKRLDEAREAEKNKRETIIRVTEAAYRGAAAWSSPEFEKELRGRLDDGDFRAQLLGRLRLDGSMADIRSGVSSLAKLLQELTR